MKILITYPPLKSEKGVPLLSQNRQFQWFNNPSYLYPVIPASAATLLKSKAYQVLWKDAIVEKQSKAEYYNYLREQKPDLIAIETKTPVIKQHWKIINEIKEFLPKTKIILMGDHVTAFPKESLENSKTDFIITGGDYDFQLLDLANHLTRKTKSKLPKGIYYKINNKIKNTGKFELKHNLNDLPIIDRELTKNNLYNIEYNIKKYPFAYTMVGRDCPYHKCKFCSWTTLFPKFRTRTPESLLNEIGQLIKNYKVKEVFDDTGTFPPGEWLRKFCKGMIERGYNKKIKLSCNMRVDYINKKDAELMKQAGFRLLKVGLESANQETLDKINKGITVQQITEACKIAKKAGLEIHLTMIVGYPWETKQQALNTFKLAKNLMVSGLADVLQSTIIVPYPGTPLFKEAIKNNWFRFNPKDYNKYDMSEPVLKTPDMSSQEIINICSKIYKVFLNPKYIFHRLISIKNLSDLKFNLKGIKPVFGHLRDFARLK